MSPSGDNAGVPRYIALPPPMFGQTSGTSPPASPLWSPALEMYHTAPSTPITSPLIEVPPPAETPASNLHITIPAPTDPRTDIDLEDAFPTVEIPIDLVDDEGLTALEKIYLFARSHSVFHRLFIVHALPSLLRQVAPQEALDFVLPLIPCLAIDEDERVKEVLVNELVSIIWWFFTSCQVVLESPDVEATVYSSPTSTIPVQAFTPTLGTLLLSPNSKVYGGAKYAIVNILAKMRKLDDREAEGIVPSRSPLVSGSESEYDSDEDNEDLSVGLFGKEERLMFEHELLQQVVIGMGRLDAEDDVDVDSNSGHISHEATPESWSAPVLGIAVATPEEDSHSQYRNLTPPELVQPEKISPAAEPVTSYFPALPAYSVPSPGSSNSSTPSSVTDTSSSSSSSPSGAQSETMPKGSPLRSRPSSKPGSPHIESPSNTSPVASSLASPRQKAFYLPGSSSDIGTDEHDDTDDGEGEGDQAAMGRLSSMSLMAAVTASGRLNDDTKDAFVKEVQRVGHDPVYWVRREASYALGALAKVVPDEVVLLSLIPLFDTLRQDSQWHVRCSALFALPAILTRLKPAHRRKLALDTIIPLSIDDSQPVRSGTLELLGEVLYTFHEDPNGPPEELVHLFLGRREDKRVRDGQQAAENREQVLSSLFGRPAHTEAPKAQSPLSSFYTDAARPLICAFNFPAVTLALGRERWGELRQTYLEIADNPEVPVRRSLAAGLGEMAKIIGTDNAERDLMRVWSDVVRSEEEDVRERALDCVEAFVGALEMPARLSVAADLVATWQEGRFRGWRERKAIARALTGLGEVMGQDGPKSLRDLLRQAMEDNVAAVREAAISALPRLWSMFAANNDVLANLRADIQKLSRSDVYRHRMTFVACLEALLLSAPDNIMVMAEDKLWAMVPLLADDAVVGVRIGVARLVRLASDRSPDHHQPSLAFLVDLIRHLSLDASADVRAYVQGSSPSRESSVPRPARRPKFATFSRPPPFSVSVDARTERALINGSPSRSINSNSPMTAPHPAERLEIAGFSSADIPSGQSDGERIVTVPA
ncbi:armadillo-type protein [Mycena amicta]|nr:armadillo-type protein [Mycena amicta]